MPESFLVRAKDKDGNPVMMVIKPDSFTAVTVAGQTGGSANVVGQSVGNGGWEILVAEMAPRSG